MPTGQRLHLLERPPTDAVARAMRDHSLRAELPTNKPSNAPVSQPTPIEAACHDLSQPLQSLILLQSLLAADVEGVQSALLVARMEIALNAMTAIVKRLADSHHNDVASPITRQILNPLDHDVAAVMPTAAGRRTCAATNGSSVYVVDDDASVRDSITLALEHAGHTVRPFDSSEALLARSPEVAEGCLLIDVCLPGLSGLEVLPRLRAQGCLLPVIMITGRGDVSMAVKAMKAGAIDFIEKPICQVELLAAIDLAVERSRNDQLQSEAKIDAETQISLLTKRQRQIMAMVLAGHPSKNIAADLGISQRTVETHRASIMKRTGAKSLPALARLAIVAQAELPDASLNSN